MIDREAIRQRWELFGSKLDERGQRHFAAVEAMTAGRGGIVAVHEITGIARSTIGRGLDELDGPALPDGRPWPPMRKRGRAAPALAKKGIPLPWPLLVHCGVLRTGVTPFQRNSFAKMGEQAFNTFVHKPSNLGPVQMPLLPRKGVLAIAAVIDVALHVQRRPVAARALAKQLRDRKSTRLNSSH